MRGQKEIVEFLIANDAEINVADHREMTPLNMATSMRHKEIVALFNEHAAKKGQ